MSAPPNIAPEGAPRYEPLVKVASGGMATVYVGVLRGALGFQQLVAIKRPHEHLLEDPGFRDALVREAHLASRIHHANVVDVRDIELSGESIALVMDYVEGGSLGQLVAAEGRRGKRLPPGVVVRIALDALTGLAAVHALVDDAGAPLGLVHRDVSPQNILVGLDGVAKITDFGVAKAEDASRAPTTVGTLKGKVGYMAPEYILGERPDARVDVFAMGVVLWEALAGRRLFKGTNEGNALERALREEAPAPSTIVPELGSALDAVVRRALEKDPAARYASAEAFAAELEAAARGAGLVASPSEVSRTVREALGEALAERRKAVRERLGEPGEPETRKPAAPPIEASPREEATNAADAVDATTRRLPEPRTATTQATRTRRALGVGLVFAVMTVVMGGIVIWLGAHQNNANSTSSNSAIEITNKSTQVEPQATPVVEPQASLAEVLPAPTTGASASATASASASASAPTPTPRPRPTATATATATTTAKPRGRTLPPNPYNR